MKRTPIRPTAARLAVSVGILLLTVFALILAGSPGADAAGISKPPADRPALQHSSDEHWSDLFDVHPGLGVEDYEVGAVAIHGTDVYIGGRFMHVGGIEANGIARFDTVAQQWHAMGLGVSTDCLGGFATVGAIAIDAAGNVFIGGDFEYVNGTPAQGGVQANGFAMWNGTAWVPLGAGGGIGATGATCADVSALAFQGNTLYIGGGFDHFGGVRAENVARLSGGVVTALAGDPYYGTNGPVGAFAFDGADVYMGGLFSSAGGVASNHVVKYSGGAFVSMGGGVDYDVHSLAVLDGRVYVGGYPGLENVSLKQYYQTEGENPTWVWDTVGGGVTYGGGNAGSVEGMAEYQGDLLIGGYFTYVNGDQIAIGVARWKPAMETWDTLGSGVSLAISGSIVADVATTGAKAYVVGQFGQAGGKPSHNIGLYDESFIPTPIPPKANLQVTIEADPERVNPGDTIDYCINVQNLGPDTAHDIQLTTSVPVGTTLAEAPGDECGGGGGDIFTYRVAPPSQRMAGLAMPLLTPDCTAPNVDAAGDVTCDLPDLEAYDSYAVVLHVNVTGAPGTDVVNSASVSGSVPDPVSDNNSDSVTVHIRPNVVYVSSANDCGGQTPCYTEIYDAQNDIAEGGTLNLLAGTYDASLYLYDDLTVNVNGDVTLNGDLYIDSGVFNAGLGVLAVTRDLTLGDGTFNRQTGTVRFSGSYTQHIYGAFQFHNIIVAEGAELDLQDQPLDYDGTFTNEGVVLYSDQQEVVADTPAVFSLGVNRPTVQLTVTGGDLGYTYVYVTLGSAPDTCYDDPFPATPLARQFVISPSNPDAADVTLRLYYDPSELGDLDSTSIRIYHCNSETLVWEELGGTPGTEDGKSFVEFSGVTSFSPFGLGSVPVPTASTLLSFDGSAQANSAHLQWSTANEQSLLGFNLWRSSNAQKGYAQLNASLIPAQNPGALMGADYAWDDTTASAGTYYYKLELLRAGGGSEMSDPVAVTLSAACANGLSPLTGIRPKNGTNLKKPTAVIKWQPSACATTYQVQVHVGSPDGRIVFSKDALAKHRVKFKKLTPNKWYYVSVRACSDGTCGAWSEIHKFRYKQ